MLRVPPLKERVLRSYRTSSPPTVSSQKPKKYKHWSEERLQLAYDAWHKEGGRVSIRQVATEYDVPKSTLSDRISGKVQFGAHCGPARYLTDDEEAELVNFLTGCSAIGYARSKQQVLALVRGVLSQKGRSGVVSTGWFEGFKHRHPKLTLRKPEKLSYIRKVSSDPDIIDHYFDLLEKTLEDNNLLDKPCQIFNCDESGMPLDPDPPMVIARKGDKHPRSVTTGDKAQVTVLACCSASGYAIPPLVVFDRKKLKPELTIGEVPGTTYGLSESGWMDVELFELWFQHHFLAYAPQCRPLLLLLDGPPPTLAHNLSE